MQLTPKQIASIAECYASKIESSKKRGKDFNLSFSTFVNIKLQTHCAYTGVELTAKTFSFERILNDEGYIDGNVIPVDREINQLRSDMDFEDILPRIEVLKSEIERYNKRREVSSSFLQNPPSFDESEIPVVVNRKIPRVSVQVQRKIHTLQKLVNENQELWAGRRKTQTQYLEFVDKHENRGSKRHTPKQIKWFKEQIPRLQKNIDKYLNLKNRYQGQIHAALAECPYTIKEVERGDKEIRDARAAFDDRIESHMRNYEDMSARVIKAMKIIEQLESLYEGMKKFQNLSAIDKEKLRFGLSLDTSTLKTLKHKIGYNMTMNSI